MVYGFLASLVFFASVCCCGCNCVFYCSFIVLMLYLGFLSVGGGLLVSSLVSSLRSSTSILQCLIGRCAWRRHLSPLVYCGHGDIIVCPLPYRLLYRAFGDGPWSFFLPYGALFPVVTVGFVWSSAPSCRCVAFGARRLATGPSIV